MSAYSSAHASPPGRSGAARSAGAPAGLGARERSSSTGLAPQSYAAPTHARAAASPVRLWAGVGAVARSLILAIVVLAAFSTPARLFGEFSLPLVSDGSGWLSLLGYVLTPLIVILAYGWDVAWQRRARENNRNVVLRRGYTRALKWLMIAGIVLGAWHVLNLAVPVSAWLAPA